MGSILDDVLRAMLREKIGKNLPSNDRQAMFDFNGVLGSFSARITISVAFGCLPKAMKKQLDLFRHMRNAAAHAIGKISFDDEALRNAVMLLFEQRDRRKMSSWNSMDYKRAFIRAG